MCLVGKKKEKENIFPLQLYVLTDVFVDAELSITRLCQIFLLFYFYFSQMSRREKHTNAIIFLFSCLSVYL